MYQCERKHNPTKAVRVFQAKERAEAAQLRAVTRYDAMALERRGTRGGQR